MMMMITNDCRFPRVTRVRSDKCPRTATSLPELLRLYEISKTQVFKLGEDVDMKDDCVKEDVNVKSEPTDSGRKSTLTTRKSRPTKTFESQQSTRRDVKVKEEASSSSCSDTSFVDGERKTALVCDLPNLFDGIVVESFPKQFEYYEDVVRYFIAYGGKISNKGVTHKIGSKKGTVKLDWIWNSVRRRTKLAEADFMN